MIDIIIEDGSIVEGANSYVTISGVNDYVDSYGYTTTWSGTDIDDTIRKQSLLKAMRYIEGLPFRGKKQTKEQPLEFPRSDIYDDDNYLFDENYIPPKLKSAVCEACILMLPNSDIDLQPIISKDDYTTAEKVSSAVAVYYDTKAGGYRTRSTIIEDLLKDIIKNKTIVEIKRG